MRARRRVLAVVSLAIVTLLAHPAASAPLFSAPFLSFDVVKPPDGIAINRLTR